MPGGRRGPHLSRRTHSRLARGSTEEPYCGTGRALKAAVRISKMSVGSLLVRKGLVRFVQAFGHSGRNNKDPDDPRVPEWKRFPHASKVPVAHTSNGCQDN